MSHCRCEPRLEGLAELSEHPAVVIAAYLVVIFPWGIIQNVDFISEKWRTVSHTCNLGYVHLALSIIPLPYIVFYAHLQQISRDYKEMMAAVVVILMAMYHISRTIWGLLQLDAYRMWSRDLMQRMLALKMVRAEEWQWKLHSAELSVWERLKRKLGCGNAIIIRHFVPGALVDESDRVIDQMDRMLKVNNEVVDNEWGGTDLAVSVDWKKIGFRRPSGWLKTRETALCSARWCASFLCEFGHYWSSPSCSYSGQREFLEALFSSCSRSLGALKNVRFPSSEMGSSIKYYTCEDSLTTNTVYGSSAIEDLEDLKSRAFIMDNIASAYPATEFHERYVLVDLVVALLDVKNVEYTLLSALAKYSSTFSLSGVSNRWKLLLWQGGELPEDSNSRLWNLTENDIPTFPWSHLSVPLWDVCTNWRVLQATVHADNGSWFGHLQEPSPPSQPPTCYCESTRQTVAAMNLSDQHKFTGCVMEMVRTFLADWVHTRPSDATAPDWSPLLPNDSLEFTYNRNDEDLLWECQCQLQTTIANMERADKDMAASPHLIMLLILGFPGTEQAFQRSRLHSVSESTDTLAAEHDADRHDGAIVLASPGSSYEHYEYYDDESNVREYTYGSPFAPQDISVIVQDVDINGEAKMIVKLVAHNSVERFIWADWIDAAMGYMKGADTHFNAVHEINWRKRTPSKCDLNRPLLFIPKGHPEVPELPGDIRVWTGWPLFDIKVVQFEMNQWMEAAGLMHGFGEVSRPEGFGRSGIDDEEVERAEAGLLKIMEWNRG